MERIEMNQAERDKLDWLRRARDKVMSQRAVAEKAQLASPVGARHKQGRSKASIGKSEQGRGSRQGRQGRHKTEPQVTERYGAGY